MVCSHPVLTGRTAITVFLPTVAVTICIVPSVVILLTIVGQLGASILLHSLLDGLVNHLADHFTRRAARLSVYIRQLPGSGLFGRRGRRRGSVCLGESRESREYKNGGRSRRAARESHGVLHSIGRGLPQADWASPNWRCLRLFRPAFQVTRKLREPTFEQPLASCGAAMTDHGDRRCSPSGQFSSRPEIWSDPGVLGTMKRPSRHVGCILNSAQPLAYPFFTVGHSNRKIEEFIDILRQGRIGIGAFSFHVAQR